MRWTGTSVQLTEEMRIALRKLPISSNYRIAEAAKGRLNHPLGRQPFEVVYFVTVVPETQAQHPLGTEGFAQYVLDSLEELVKKPQRPHMPFVRADCASSSKVPVN